MIDSLYEMAVECCCVLQWIWVDCYSKPCWNIGPGRTAAPWMRKRSWTMVRQSITPISFAYPVFRLFPYRVSYYVCVCFFSERRPWEQDTERKRLFPSATTHSCHFWWSWRKNIVQVCFLTSVHLCLWSCWINRLARMLQASVLWLCVCAGCSVETLGARLNPCCSMKRSRSGWLTSQWMWVLKTLQCWSCM